MKRLFHRPLLFVLAALLLIAGLVMLVGPRESRQEEKNRALIEAVKRNDAAAVIALLNAGADANAKDLTRYTRPVSQVFWDIVHRRPQPPPQTEWRPTALQLIGTRQSLRSAQPDPYLVARALLEHGADPNVTNEQDTPPLAHALGRHQDETALLLIQHGAKMVEVLTMSEDYRLPMKQRRKWGELSLFGQAGLFHAGPRVLEAMLDKGADINAPDSNGDTVLMNAAVSGAISSVRLLLSHHANVTVKDLHGRSALSYALYYARTHPSPTANQIIQLLRQAGAR